MMLRSKTIRTLSLALFVFMALSGFVAMTPLSLAVSAAPAAPSPGAPAAASSGPSSAQLACEGTGATYDVATKTCGSTGKALFGPGGIVSKVINTLLFLVGGLAVLMVIVGGIRYVVSAGDQNAVTAAKNTILYAIIGLVIAFLAYGIVQFLVGALS
ncbi:hypothetical protein KA529_00215 [Candidatus Saccharibacteria bacterium]|jgi:hypothetical protein|nr:hypothetical protein [Candidatus Saccharibacteria bacterium]